ncbi:cytochrome P450 family protein [Piscinibacter terrae]|uniref:Cytochrome P450 n=1 Tax=Piscinibacter terrae TaxID=2496871 RepID=A0A3N7HMC1_9BURK|nr:cytochrome P450 [Albitalea terrae]RQP22206.1 cytochrome P450 [Albitalea terrae]
MIIPDLPRDPVAAVTHRDPYPYYEQLLRGPGLHFDETLRIWVAAQARVVESVLGDARWRVRPLHEPVPAAIAGGGAGEIFGALVRMNEGTQTHEQPKLALHRALASVDLSAVAQRASELSARSLPKGEQGLSDWAFQVPVQSVASLLGFEDSQLADASGWMRRFVASLSPLSTPQQIGQAHEAARTLIEEMKRLVDKHQGGGLIGQVLEHAKLVGWDQADAIVANLVGLMSQTFDATAGLIGNTIVALARTDRRHWPSAAEIPPFVDAVVLNDPPVQNTRRFAACDMHFEGQSIPQGAPLLVVLATASRDSGRPFGFGHGRHACPGQVLATSIASAAVSTLLTAPALITPDLRWHYRPSANARIPEFTTAQGAPA